jgi:hypothetical protein
MLTFNTNDPGSTPYTLQRAIKESGLTLQKVCERLKSDHGIKLSNSSLSRMISRNTVKLQLDLHILAICGVGEVRIKSEELDMGL